MRRSYAHSCKEDLALVQRLKAVGKPIPSVVSSGHGYCVMEHRDSRDSPALSETGPAHQASSYNTAWLAGSGPETRSPAVACCQPPAAL